MDARAIVGGRQLLPRTWKAGQKLQERELYGQKLQGTETATAVTQWAIVARGNSSGRQAQVLA